MSEAKTTDPATRAPAPRRWRRWLRRLLVLGLVLAIIIRIVLWLALPWLVAKVAPTLGIDASLERSQLSLLGGSVQLWNLDVRDPDAEAASPPLLHLEYAHVDLVTTALLWGEVRIRRAEIDGLDTHLVRTNDGLRLPAAWTAPAATDSEPVEPAPAADDAPAPLPLALPVRIDALRAQHVRATLRDERTTPARDLLVDVSLRVTDLGAADAATRVELALHSPQLLDALRLEGQGNTGGPELDLQLETTVAGLRPGALHDELVALGLTPLAKRIDATATLDVRIAGCALPAGEGGDAAAAGDPDARLIELALHNVALEADATTAVAVETIDIAIPELAPHSIDVATVRIAGVRCSAARDASGTMHVAGFAVTPTATPPAPDATPVAPPAPAATTDSPPFAWRVQRLDIHDIQARFADAAVTPPTDLALIVERVELRDLDPAAGPDAPASAFAATVHAPGVFSQLTLNGGLHPLAADHHATLALRCEGLEPTILEPYLAAAGIESTLDNGTLIAQLDARYTTAGDAVRTNVTLTDLSLENAGTALALGRLEVRDAVADASGLAIEAITLVGTRAPVRLTAERVLELPGVRLVGAATPAAPPTPDAPPPDARAAGAPAAAPPAEPDADADGGAFALGSLRWEDARLLWTDETETPPIRDLALVINAEVDDLRLAADRSVVTPTTLSLRAEAAGVVDALELSGTLSCALAPLELDTQLELRGQGLRAGPFTPHLEALGVEPLLQSGELSLRATAQLRPADDGTTRADLQLGPIALRDGQQSWFELTSAVVEDARLGADGVAVAAVEIEGPRLTVARDQDGGLRTFGVRLPPPATDADPAAPPPVAAETPVEPTPEQAVAAAPTEPPPTDPASTAPAAALGRLALRGAEVVWRDDAVAGATPVQARATLEATISDLAVGAGVDPAAFAIELKVDEALEAITASGSLRADPAQLELEAEVAARGLRGDGVIAAYLPPNASMTMRDGAFGLQLRAALIERTGPEQSGWDALATLTDLALRDGTQPPWLSLAEATVAVPRLDPAGGMIDVDRVVTRNLTMRVHRHEDGAIEAMGMRMAPAADDASPPVAPPPVAPPPVAPVAQAAAAAPGPSVATVTPGTVTAATAGAATAPLADALPEIRIGTIDLGIAALDVIDDTAEGPPVRASLQLTSQAPFTLLNTTPDELDPLHLQLRAAVTPLVDEALIDVFCRPFAQRPELEAQVAVRGLHGDQLRAVAPGLAEQLDASALAGGTFTANLRTELTQRRRSPVGFDLARSFGIDFEVADVVLRGTEDGPPLASLDAVRLVAPRIRLSDTTVHVKLLEIDAPRCDVVLKEEGTEICGLLLRNPPPAAATATPPEEGPETVAAAPTPAASGAQETPAAEQRIDVFRLSGLDITIRDQLGSRPSEFPLMLELVARQLTSRALYEPIPARWQLSVYGGEIQLPKRLDDAALIGITKAAAQALVGTRDEHELESRPALDELAFSGELALYPQPRGWVKLNAQQFELQALQSLAKRGGVDIADGVLNAGVAVQIGDATAVDAMFDFNHLSLSEPPGGPISTYLRLPAPLDSVLFVLKDDQGRHRIPLALGVGAGGVSGAQIATAAVSALGQLIGSAIASSPLRAANAVTSVVPGTTDVPVVGGLFRRIFGGEPKDLSTYERRLPFAAGSTWLDALGRGYVDEIVELLRSDDQVCIVLRHDLGGADQHALGPLVLPDPDSTRDLSRRLRHDKAALLRRRDELAADTRAAHRLEQSVRARSLGAQLRQAERDLAAAEQALDDVLELLRPGAQRRQKSRVRTASRALGTERLDVVAAMLGAAGIDLQRIDVRPARPTPLASLTSGGEVRLEPVRRSK
ncbi:MAG: DUF748 domain-containing protein [Planctomycetota bacterium]